MKNILVLFFLLIPAILSYSQWTSNISQNNSVVIAPNNQLNAKAIPDGEGGVIIVWEDYRVSTSNRDIYAQRFDKYGFKQWGDSTGIALGIKSITERYPDVCTDGKGGAFFVWDDNPISTVTYLKAQRITKSGIKFWSDTGSVLAYNGNRQSTGKIVSDNNGGFYVAYFTSELLSTDYELKANRIDSSGNKLWSNGVFFCQADGLPSEFSVTLTSDNGFAIAWCDPRNSILTDYDIYVQKLSSAGLPLWQANGVPVCTQRFTQQYQDIFPDINGGVFIDWCDKRDSIQYEIYAQRVRANGTIAGPTDGKAVCIASDDQYRPYMTTDGFGGVIMCWNDFRNGPAFPFNIDIYAQRMDSSCNIKWTSNGVNVCNAIYSQNNQSIISDSAKGAIICWDDRRAGTSIYDIYAQRIDSSGNLLWDTADVAISIASGNQYKPKPVLTTGGALICFEDTRNGSSNYDLFIQKVLLNGSTLVPVKENIKAIDDFRLEQNYPNPFNPSTNVKFSIANVKFVTLKVFDVLGKEVATLVSERLQPGTYEVTFDARNLSSGIYFYKLESGAFVDTKHMLLIK
jgi:hypothetical protein